MDLGLFYFADAGDTVDADRYRLLLDGARFADDHGFSAVWTPERHFHPFGGLYPNPSVTSAAIAAVTRNVEIRAGSVVAPLHPPVRIAEEWAVVDNLSGGRVGLAFASGWHAKDFALRPENYADRRQITLDTADTVRRLWSGESVELADGTGEPCDVRIYPTPIRHRLPIWITSAGGVETFQSAGAMGAGVLTHLLGQDLEDLKAKIGAYRAAVAARPDADGWPGHVVVMVHTFLGADEDRVREQVEAPLCDYLRSSLGLLLGSQAHGARRIDPAQLSEKDREFLVRRSFDRYYSDGGLLGTVDKAAKVIDRLALLGVDEVACLIDFGPPAGQVLDGLTHLNELREYAAEVKSAS